MIVKRNPDEFLNYLNDTSGLKAGPVSGVYIPEGTEEVSEILKQASERGEPVTVSGNGTGTTGGRVPNSGIILATDRLNRIGRFMSHPDGTGEVSVQAGVLLKTLQTEALENGFLYPPDPTERNAFIGGTIATNASGSRSFRYGATRRWVSELTVVLSDGTVLIIPRGQYVASGNEFDSSIQGRRVRFTIPDISMPGVKHAAGYFSEPGMDLIDLFIGSEGTLGVITEAKVKLLPKPSRFFSGIFFFPEEQDLFAFVSSVKTESVANPGSLTRLNATSLEYFDLNSLGFLKEKYPQTPDQAKGAIYFEQECNPETEDALLEAWFDLLVRHNGLPESSWFAQSAREEDFFKEYRHALPALINEFLSKNGVRKISSDIAVPENKFSEMMAVYHRFLDESPFKWVIFGHIGDQHLHMNILPRSAEEHDQGKLIYLEFIREALKLGGTISAEHGVGKLKVPYAEMMFGDTGLKEMARVKRYFDPAGILGRGTVFPEKML